MLNPGEGERDADRWTNTPEARSYLSHLANVTADIVALDAFTAAVEAADAVAFDDTLMRRAVPGIIERLLGLHLGALPGRTAYRPLARWPARAALRAPLIWSPATPRGTDRRQV